MTLAVVTGAGRGIGRETALALAARGIDLVLVGRTPWDLEQTAEQARLRNVVVHSAIADLESVSETESAARSILAVGVPDAVIHNAGIIERASVDETSTDSWDRQFAVNTRAPFVLTRELLPALRSAGRGRMVFVGSISSTLGTPRAAAYCATKWALVGFVKSLAAELSDSGLSAVCLLPGSVDTSMLEGSGFAPRMSADDVARTIVHFALDAPLAHNGGVVEMFGV